MLIILLLLAVVSYLLFSFYSKVKRLPPGPAPLPLIGNLHQLGWTIMKEGGMVAAHRKWQKMHGNVYTFWLGPLPTVNIGDYDTAVEAMVKKGKAFVDRPSMFLFDVVREGRGIITSNGEHWTEQRRFALHTLRNMGLGRNIMQDRIMLEYDYRTANLDEKIKENEGSYSLDPYHFLELTIGNIINRLLFSERFTEDNEKKFFALKKIVDEVTDNISIIDMIINEWNSKFPPFKGRYENFKKPIEDIVAFTSEQIEAKKQEIANGKHELRDEGEDFVDAFLIEIAKSDHGASFDETTLKMTLLDLWFAGQETTTTSLYWGLTFLLLHPEVVVKMRAELDAVTGRSRRLELADKPNTPFTNATILEILRLSSIVPLNAWRVTSEDTEVGGHFVPQGTWISAQISLIMSDDRNFKEAEKFKPDRFLEGESDQHVLAFSLGKRACIGESLARAELYLIIGNLLLSYDLKVDEARPPTMKCPTANGSTRKAQRFNMIVSQRE